MSSHREAPEISQDPTADGTDVYAFRSPSNENNVVLISNFIPLQKPDSGPNFFEFSDDVLYDIHVSNKGKAGKPNVTFRFKFKTRIRNKDTFLYNTGPITGIRDETFNRPQFYDVTMFKNGRPRVLARNLLCPPCNVGVRSTPDYATLAQQGTYTLGNRMVYAGQRADAFHVDLGSIFDLGALRPFNEAHLIGMPAMGGVDAVESFNCHTIAVEVPISDLTSDGSVPTPDDVMARKSTIGVFSTASRRKGRVFNTNKGKYRNTGPWVLVSRLGNPLFNEVLVPMSKKDIWNASEPAEDATYAPNVASPELQGLLPALYPGVFPNLAAYNKPRADLDAILLTGIPEGVVPGFQNYTGPNKADMLRLNLAVPVTPPADANPIGLVAGDAQGFPNGRRLIDDVVAIELRAIAGATIPLVDPDYTPDDAAGALTDGTTVNSDDLIDQFPYIGLPKGGYQARPGSSAVEGPGEAS